jgi:monofunctional biosynthetic peptidoglycan transglycosylase
MIRKFIKTVFMFFGIYILSTLIVVSVFILINPATSAFILSADSEAVENVFIPNSVLNGWSSYGNISAYSKLAVIASEDQTFKDHFGFDLKQIEKAWRDKERGRRVRGASTISMQVAKNLFLYEDKNLIRKGLEAYYTLIIETLWSKKRILEVYLNIAQFGENVFGLQAAAENFYNKKPSELTLHQAATLAAVLPNPVRFSAKRPSRYIVFRRGNIIRQMYLIGWKNYLNEL